MEAPSRRAGADRSRSGEGDCGSFRESERERTRGVNLRGLHRSRLAKAPEYPGLSSEYSNVRAADDAATTITGAAFFASLGTIASVVIKLTDSPQHQTD